MDIKIQTSIETKEVSSSCSPLRRTSISTSCNACQTSGPFFVVDSRRHWPFSAAVCGVIEGWRDCGWTEREVRLELKNRGKYDISGMK